MMSKDSEEEAREGEWCMRDMVSFVASLLQAASQRQIESANPQDRT